MAATSVLPRIGGGGGGGGAAKLLHTYLKDYKQNFIKLLSNFMRYYLTKKIISKRFRHTLNVIFSVSIRKVTRVSKFIAQIFET